MTKIRDLVVFSSLKVHQLIVEPKRVKATYTIVKADNSIVENELIYTYSTVYFSKKEVVDVNLASMMIAQVALNYGLFFEKIEFDGLFDDADKRFLSI